MRKLAFLAFPLLAACASGDISVPRDPVIQQVTPNYGAMPTTSASSAGGAGMDFTSTIRSSLDEPGAGQVAGSGQMGAVTACPGCPPVNPNGTPLDDDSLNLTLYTIEQQKVDARLAQQQLDAARSRLVVDRPGSVPQGVAGVNIALYAQQSGNAVGERVYARRGGGGGACGRYPNSDAAQRAFLAAGGPASDSLGLDPDGDGFACKWDPTPYRQLRS
jgi:hypothetical protein